MEHTSHSPNRTVNKTRRNETVKVPWKNTKKQNYPQKWRNMNTQKSDMTRGPLQGITKVWRRKSEGQQKEEVCEPRIDANSECSKHTMENQTKGSTLD